MAECGNIFENFIANFYVKFGKLQIRGFHGKGQVPAFRDNRTVSPGKQRMMSNIRGNDTDNYGQVTGKSRVVKNHTYGQQQQNQMMRNVSSNLDTDNFNSNTALPAVNEYADDMQKPPTMFDPLPVDGGSIKKNDLAQDSSKDLNAPNTSSIQRELQAQESDR